jgi:hypothetical protein
VHESCWLRGIGLESGARYALGRGLNLLDAPHVPSHPPVAPLTRAQAFGDGRAMQDNSSTLDAARDAVRQRTVSLYVSTRTGGRTVFYAANSPGSLRMTSPPVPYSTSVATCGEGGSTIKMSASGILTESDWSRTQLPARLSIARCRQSLGTQ